MDPGEPALQGTARHIRIEAVEDAVSTALIGNDIFHEHLIGRGRFVMWIVVSFAEYGGSVEVLNQVGTRFDHGSKHGIATLRLLDHDGRTSKQ